MRILDLSAGNRAIWWDKKYRDALFVDKREAVKPDIRCDTCSLPDEVGVGYDLLVFDPPHANFGANSNFSKSYGHHTAAEIKATILGTAQEAHRVSRPDALMAFKWNDHDTKLSTVLALMDPWWEPLFGHNVSSRTKHSSTTYWVLLRRRDLEKGFE